MFFESERRKYIFPSSSAEIISASEIPNWVTLSEVINSLLTCNFASINARFYQIHAALPSIS